MNQTVFTNNPFPKVGIRPIIDGRRRGVRESLEDQTMAMAKAAAKLISDNLRYPDGSKVECVIADTTIGGRFEAAQCANKFAANNVGVSLSVTPCWCYGTETMDVDPVIPKAVWGFNGTERPGAVYLACMLAGYAQRGMPAYGIYGHEVQNRDESDKIPADVAEKILRFAKAGLAVAMMKGKSYLSIGTSAMGIAGSFVDVNFMQDYLGIAPENMDECEILRRIEEGIYDKEEYKKALAWMKKNLKEGKDYNPPKIQKSRAEKDKDWEFIAKMAIIVRDMMAGNPKLKEMGFGEEAVGRNAIAGGFQGQRQWTDHWPNGDVAEVMCNTSFDWNGKKMPQILATENDSLNGICMLLMWLLTNKASMFEGTVQSCTFQGVHYEITVITDEGYEIIVQDYNPFPAGMKVSMVIKPQDIQVMRKERTCNTFEGKLVDAAHVEMLGIVFECLPQDMYRGEKLDVSVEVDFDKVDLLDGEQLAQVIKILRDFQPKAEIITTSQGKVTFLDTPGHEAFSAMRARGSQVTDVIVLVVAADSMVMPQTVESIELAKREKVPMVVAITKIDLPTANPDKIRAQLAERGVEVEQWGGSTSCIEVSARTGQGMNELLETLALEAEVLELKANPDAHARGAVVESKLDVGKGSMATILVQNGTLHVGDPFVCGIYAGRVRAMFNERGEQMKVAPPSAPCQVLGFDGTPQAGDDLIVVEDEKTAREIASKRRMAARERDLRARKTVSLENSFNEKKEGKLSELNLIVKADVGGSAEALAASLEKLTNKEVRVNIIRKGVGTITESDILLATTAQAIIISFHLMPSLSIREMAEKEGIEIRNYRVIYDCIEDITNAVEGLLKPIMREELVGEAEIRQVFKIPKIGLIAGCMVTDGEVDRTSHVRVYRNGIELGTTVVQSLKRMKDDVKSVARGFECGIGLKGYEDIKEGDSLIFFKEVKVARTLKDVAREEAEEKANKAAEESNES